MFKITLTIAAVALVATAGCGGSSKPSYCSDTSNLEKSIKAVPGLVTSRDVSGLQTQATTIQTDAKTLVSDAKSNFPSQTSAIKSSVATLQSAVKALPSSPTAKDLEPIAVAAAAVVTSVKDFTTATSSKCS